MNSSQADLSKFSQKVGFFSYEFSLLKKMGKSTRDKMEFPFPTSNGDNSIIGSLTGEVPFVV